MLKCSMRSIVLSIMCLSLAGCGHSSDASKNILSSDSKLFQELSGGEAIQAITQLKGGSSPSRLYSVIGEKQEYILRTLDKRRAKESIQTEIEVSRALGEKGVAPKVYGASVEKAGILLQKVKGDPLFVPKLTKDQLIDLAKKMRLTHQVRSIGTKKHVSPLYLVKFIIREDLAFPLPDEYQKALERLAPSFKALEDPAQFALTHSDLNPGNILFGEEGIKIIDWEDAWVTHPYLDVATIFIFYDLSQQEKELFLKTYSDSVDPVLLDAASRVMNYIYGLRFLSKLSQPPQEGTLRNLMRNRQWSEIIGLLDEQGKTTISTMARLFLEKALSPKKDDNHET